MRTPTNHATIAQDINQTAPHLVFWYRDAKEAVIAHDDPRGLDESWGKGPKQGNTIMLSGDSVFEKSDLENIS